MAVVERERPRLRAAQAGADQNEVLADVLEDTAREYRPFLDRLEALRPPQELAADWRRFLDGVREAFDLIPEVADASREGDREKLSDLTTRFAQIAGDTRPFAQKHGLGDCLPDSGPG